MRWRGPARKGMGPEYRKLAEADFAQSVKLDPSNRAAREALAVDGRQHAATLWPPTTGGAGFVDDALAAGVRQFASVDELHVALFEEWDLVAKHAPWAAQRKPAWAPPPRAH